MSTLRHRSYTTPLAICVGLVALTWLVFGQTLGHDFVNYDDPNYVYENPRITAGISFTGVAWAFTHIHAQNWHPLTTISHMLDSQVYGLRATGHHFTNVLLHTVAVTLLFFGLRQMTGTTWRSAMVAAIFAIHPLRVESVAWVAERKDVLSGVFFMLTLLSYIRYVRRPSLSSYFIVALCLALGLMSKPMLVTLPAVLLLLDYWPLERFVGERRDQGRPRVLLEKLPLLLLVAGACAATLAAQSEYIGAGETLPWLWRANNAATTCVVYLRQMFWPAGLVPFYPHPENSLTTTQTLGAVVSLLVVSITAVMQRRQRPYLLVGWLWYLGMLIPVIGLVQVGWQGHADRYTYLPGIGISVAVVWGAAELISRFRVGRVVATLTAVLVLGCLSSVAWKQTTYWRNSEWLWTHTLAVIPDNDVAHTNLAMVLLARGEKESATAHYEAALGLRPGNVSAHISLANILIYGGRVSEGVKHLQRALELEPGNTEAHNLLGVVRLQQGDAEGALREWQKTLEFDRTNGNALSNLAWVYATNPEPAVRNGTKAVTLAREAAAVSGGRNALVTRTLAAALAEAGLFDEAIIATHKALDQALADGNNALVSELEATIGLYTSHTPLRDPSQSQPRSSE